MNGSPNIARLGALIGDPARATMLTALMSGRALTAGELAREAGITIQTASSHLAKLEQGRLLRLRKQGRHKYFALYSDEVAWVLEGLMALTPRSAQPRVWVGPKDKALRQARVCYNHLAGDKGVQLYDSLLAKGYITKVDGTLRLSHAGEQFAEQFGIDLNALRAKKTPLCRECLDWSERRSHLAGSLGRAFFSRFEALRWLQRDQDTRAVRFTRKGEADFRAVCSG